MAKRSAFLVQILDKIGAPLLAAIESSGASSAGDKGVQDAQTLAALLSRAVEMSVNMSQNMDLKGSEEDADSVRLALAALAGPLIADVYKVTHKIPDDNDLKRMNKTLEAVLTFSDNFAPSATHISRLKSLDDTPVHADEDQNTIYVLQALLPVLAAIAEFPFGQQETALVQDISKRLQDHAHDLRQRMLTDGQEDESRARYVELMILKALAQVYAESHIAQTKKLLQQQESGSEGPDITMDNVWQSFELKLSMLEALVGASMPGGIPQSASGSTVVPDPAPAPVTPEPPAAPQAAAPATPPAPAAEAGSSNPMTFFKPPGGEEGQPVTPPTPQEAPPPASNPVAPPQQPEVPQQPTPQETPQQPPQEVPKPAESSSNPMAFFKPPAKNTDENGQS